MTYKILLSGRDDHGRKVYNVLDDHGNIIYSGNYYYTQKFLKYMMGGFSNGKGEKDGRSQEVQRAR